MYNEIKKQAEIAVKELLTVAKLHKNDILVIGCSTSELTGNKIGTTSDFDPAKAVFDGVYPILKENGIFLAAQCCEHLNRAIIIERECALHYGYDEVNVIPQIKAGGAFATTVYNNFADPVAVESIKAAAGIDIGSTLIGMHIKSVVVPVRISIDMIGGARLTLARSRAKFVGGQRAVYDQNLM